MIAGAPSRRAVVPSCLRAVRCVHNVNETAHLRIVARSVRTQTGRGDELETN